MIHVELELARSLGWADLRVELVVDAYKVVGRPPDGPRRRQVFVWGDVARRHSARELLLTHVDARLLRSELDCALAEFCDLADQLFFEEAYLSEDDAPMSDEALSLLERRYIHLRSVIARDAIDRFRLCVENQRCSY